MNYTARYGRAVIKRLGYLLEVLEIKHPVIEKFRNARSSLHCLIHHCRKKEKCSDVGIYR